MHSSFHSAQFLRGIAQLNFLKDPFIVRMLRELLRTVFFSVGAKDVAVRREIHVSSRPFLTSSFCILFWFFQSAVQMSDLTLYRAHLLKVLAQEFISHMDEPSNGWSENAKMVGQGYSIGYYGSESVLRVQD